MLVLIHSDLKHVINQFQHNLKNYEHVRKQGSCPNPLYQKHDVN